MTRFAITHVPALLGNGAIDRLFEEFFQNPEPYVRQTTNGYPLTDIYCCDLSNRLNYLIIG